MASTWRSKNSLLSMTVPRYLFCLTGSTALLSITTGEILLGFPKINTHLLCFFHITVQEGWFTPVNKIAHYRTMFRVVSAEEGHNHRIIWKKSIKSRRTRDMVHSRCWKKNIKKCPCRIIHTWARRVGKLKGSNLCCTESKSASFTDFSKVFITREVSATGLKSCAFGVYS